ncbi:MAG: putative membrane protein [Arenicella sp.]|jgi:putative membrane protein
MKLVAKLLALFVAISHVGILILEMFFWNHPVGQRIFAMTPEVAEASEVLAMNQGLYNGFLAAGLFWGLLKDRFDVIVFFLSCVIVAGVFGAATAKFSILFTQGMPAMLALAAAIVSRAKFTQ